VGEEEEQEGWQGKRASRQNTGNEQKPWKKQQGIVP
jgi:hypothetical protein